MAKTKLFDSDTWRLPHPAPFDDASLRVKRTDVYSTYNPTAKKESTLHATTLQAILTYMELDIASSSGTSTKGAIGTQGSEKIIAEYPSRTGDNHVIVFNKPSGKFIAGVFTSAADAPQSYRVLSSSHTGAALFFTLIPEAMTDSEFASEYKTLLECKEDSYSDMKKAADAAFMLCDNLYRRIENAASLGLAGIKIDIPVSGNIATLTPVALDKNVYSPTNVLLGTFEKLKPGMASTAPVESVDHKDFSGKYAFSSRIFSAIEKRLIPTLEKWYVIPDEIVQVCKHAQMTTESNQPMRNFMLRGEAGTGKTEGAKAIAAGLGLPYVHLTCSANTEITDLLGQILPVMDKDFTAMATPVSLPSFDDIRIDPPTAYSRLTGEYDEEVTEGEVYDKLLEVIAQIAKAEAAGTGDKKQGFRYVDTTLVDAIRYGYCLELQEPSIIANPGVLVGLNSLLDRCNSILLPTGERIERHPDTVIIVTTNNDYNGCKPMNQSVLSRMNLVIDVEEPDLPTLVERVSGLTGCKDKSALTKMAETVKAIAQKCRESMITDGCCGVRELIAWVQSYMISGNMMDSAKFTVLSAVSGDAENRAEIQSECLKPIFGL